MTTHRAPASRDRHAPPAVTMAGALTAALRDAMTDDPNVVIFGEDVGTARRRVPGDRRVVAASSARRASGIPPWPRPESSAPRSAWPCTGCARWSSCSSTRSAIPRSSRSPRTWPRCATARRGTSSCPIVIRIPYAGGIGGVEHHSDSSEAYWTHTPGLTVVTPVQPGRRLLDAARGDRERRPGHLSRAEEPVLGEGPGGAAGSHRGR